MGERTPDSFSLLNNTLLGLTPTALKLALSNWFDLDVAHVDMAFSIIRSAPQLYDVSQYWITRGSWYIAEFFSSSVEIGTHDSLYFDAISWVETHVIELQNPRHLKATSSHTRAAKVRHTKLKFHADFTRTWFRHGTNFLYFHCPHGSKTNEWGELSRSPLTITCLGRSTNPIKKFLEVCQEFAAKQKQSHTHIYTAKGNCFGHPISRPHRTLSTVYFNEEVKLDLVADMERYLYPDNRNFYMARGIPYRRGYLLYGPPGTGKTSLSVALASKFDLDLFQVHLPSVDSDAHLANLFTNLPSSCIVLLEDIDAVGIRKRDASDSTKDNSTPAKKGMTLSGLLNVLDGVASQEGRIVLMTSNFAENLDDALVRPGRIDKKVFLGHIAPRTAELMFMGMYEPHGSSADTSTTNDDVTSELQDLAAAFGSKIPDATFTPAEVQGYLIEHRESPRTAVEGVDEWVIAQEQLKSQKGQHPQSKTGPQSLVLVQPPRSGSETSLEPESTNHKHISGYSVDDEYISDYSSDDDEYRYY